MPKAANRSGKAVNRFIQIERRGPSNHILWIALNHHPLNTLSAPLRKALIETLNKAHNDKSIRVIVLTGLNGAFSAGASLDEVAALEEETQARNFFASFETLYALLGTLAVPVIAAVPGPAMGGGLELVLRCDLIYASQEASFAASGINMGLIESAVTLSQRVNHRDARDLLLTGRRIDAREAADMGLINRCVDKDQLEAVVMRVARRIASRPPRSVTAVRDILERSAMTDPGSLQTRMDDYRIDLWKTQDHKEAVQAFLAKRTPDFQGE